MSLMKCPNEILEMITSRLDSETLVSLSKTHRRLRDLIRKRLEYVKLIYDTPSIEIYLYRHGDVLRHLDMSNCSWLPLPTSEIVSYLNLTKLEVVNTRLWDDDIESILNWLSKLESLSFSLQTMHSTKVIQLRRSSHLKELYVELHPDTSSFRLVIDLMNTLECLKHVHVNLVGRTLFPPFGYVPKADFQRMEKLLSFVCSCHLSIDNFLNVRIFLDRIFEDIGGTEINDWIFDEKGCYIYERGFYNMDDVVDPCNEEELEKLDLLRNFYVLDLAKRTNPKKSIRSPWGHPKSLRVKASHGFGEMVSHYDLSRVFTTALVELDFTDYHRTFSDEFWRELVWSSPHLECLAVPACSFLIPGSDKREARKPWKIWNRSKEDKIPTNDTVEVCLRKLNLKKLFVKGNEGPFSMFRYPFPKWQCPRCSRPFTARNTPQLKNLRRLGELTFKNVTIESSALEKIANPVAHTIRMRLNRMFALSGMREFIQECHSLRNFKFSGFNMPLHTKELWGVLAQGKKIEALCLGTRSLAPLEPPQLRWILLQIPRTLLQLHFHVKDLDETADFLFTLNDTLRRTGRSGFRFETKFLPDENSSVGRPLRDFELSEPFLGRSLCHTESFAGFVTPVRWEMSNHQKSGV